MPRIYLQDQVVMITGASSGIGRATALAFAAEGARLALGARRADRLEALAPELRAAGAREVVTHAVDVRDIPQIEAFVAAAMQAFGRIDILVNNAGLARGADRVDSADEDDWNEMIDTNVKGLLALSRRVAPIMNAQEGGHIINMSSTAGHWVYEGGSVYCGTKFARARHHRDHAPGTGRPSHPRSPPSRRASWRRSSAWCASTAIRSAPITSTPT